MNEAYEDLLHERYSRASTATWWPTPKAHRDSDQMQYYRRLELEAAAIDEEVTDGSIEAPSV